MRHNVGTRRALMLLLLTVSLVVGAASGAVAGPAQDPTGPREPAGCNLAPQILRIEPEIRAACVARTAVSEPAAQVPAPGGSPSGSQAISVIWLVVAGVAALAAAVAGFGLRRRPQPAV